MKTIIFLLLGALLVAALAFTVGQPARVESGVVAENPRAPERLETASERPVPANNPVPKDVSTEVTAVIPATGPATHQRESSPVPAEVFDQALTSSPEGAPKEPAQEMHERFSREVTDPNWSPNVEPQLQGHLKTEEMLKLVDFLSMECRAATCEIRAASPSVELNAQSMREFQIRFMGMTKEAWWTGYGFKYPIVHITVAPDGRAIMIGYISTLNSK